MQQRGRVTIPTDVDVVPETLTLMERWGADAIRDCDGTDYPEELRAVDAKVYSTYYTTRKDNTWAKAHPEEIQQMLYYDAVLYGGRRRFTDPSHDASVPGYVKSQQP